jgi:hypothetical protein
MLFFNKAVKAYLHFSCPSATQHQYFKYKVVYITSKVVIVLQQRHVY